MVTLDKFRNQFWPVSTPFRFLKLENFKIDENFKIMSQSETDINAEYQDQVSYISDAYRIQPRATTAILQGLRLEAFQVQHGQNKYTIISQ